MNKLSMFIVMGLALLLAIPKVKASSSFSYFQPGTGKAYLLLDTVTITKGVDNENNFIFVPSNNKSYIESSSIQTTSISLDSHDLAHPIWLQINSLQSLQSINGTLKVNGRVIQQLKQRSNQINLVPYLIRGNNKIEIVAEYYPSTASITVQLTSSTNSVTQQSSGTGKLNQTLEITLN